MTHDVRTIEPDELRAASILFGATLHHGPADDERWAGMAASYSPGRTLGVHACADLIGTATSFPSRLAVPGGAALPMAAVTRVGVRADHTRRGVLTALMQAQLRDVVDRGEPLATLRASESRIYGRFGYGVATRGRDVRVRADAAPWRAGAPHGGPVRLLGREEIVPVLRGVHDTIALQRAGGMTRPDAWWWSSVGRRVEARDHVLAAVHTGATGDDGFAVAFLGRSGSGFGDTTLDVVDLQAATIDATAGLWRFLLDVDLVGNVEGELRPLDEPLELLLADPRAVGVTGAVHDETWLRIVDVPSALAARTYRPARSTDGSVLLAVHDPLFDRNAGVYRICGRGAERVGPLDGPVRPDLECDVAGLSMAYLGDREPSALAATGWWQVRSADTLDRADALFRTAVSPWCGTFF